MTHKDALIIAIIATIAALAIGIPLLTNLEHKWQQTCMYVPLDQVSETECRR